MNIKGVIVRITPYKEQGAMVNVLSEDRLIGFYVKNIYKVNSKNVLLTTPLMYGNFTFLEPKEDDLIFKEMTPIVDTRDYMNQSDHLAAINFINEVTIRLLNDTEMPSIYPYLISSLIALKNNKNTVSILICYLATALKLNGNALQVDECVLSGSKQNIIGVSYKDGGLVSKKAFRHGEDKQYSPNKINILRKAFKVKPEDFDQINFPIDEAKEVLNDLISFAYHQTSKWFKSAVLVKKML